MQVLVPNGSEPAQASLHRSLRTAAPELALDGVRDVAVLGGRVIAACVSHVIVTLPLDAGAEIVAALSVPVLAFATRTRSSSSRRSRPVPQRARPLPATQRP